MKMYESSFQAKKGEVADRGNSQSGARRNLIAHDQPLRAFDFPHEAMQNINANVARASQLRAFGQ